MDWPGGLLVESAGSRGALAPGAWTPEIWAVGLEARKAHPLHFGCAVGILFILTAPQATYSSNSVMGVERLGVLFVDCEMARKGSGVGRGSFGKIGGNQLK